MVSRLATISRIKTHTQAVVRERRSQRKHLVWAPNIITLIKVQFLQAGLGSFYVSRTCKVLVIYYDIFFWYSRSSRSRLSMKSRHKRTTDVLLMFNFDEPLCAQYHITSSILRLPVFLFKVDRVTKF